MRNARFVFAFAVLFASAASLHAQCNNVSLGAPANAVGGSSITLTPQYPSDTTRFEIVHARPEGNSFELRSWSNVLLLPVNNTFVIPRTSDNRVERFTLNILGGSAAGCSVTVDVPVAADPLLSALRNTIVVPVAGSAPGANGARFKTTLRLTGVGSGTIYFRRQGTFSGDSSDLSLHYNLPSTFQAPGTLVLDDVVGQMGVSGLGSLDIVPDPDPTVGIRAPFVDARVYNETAEGRYGSSVPVLAGADLFTSTLGWTVNSEPNRIRTNVGIRTFSVPVTADIAITTNNGTTHTTRTFAANTFQQMPLLAFAGDVAPSSIILVTFSGGPVAAYYSETDNGTNDPTVFVPAAESQLDPRRVGTFSIP